MICPICNNKVVVLSEGDWYCHQDSCQYRFYFGQFMLFEQVISLRWQTETYKERAAMMIRLNALKEYL